jgi:phytoene dehydrogenase-like protein
MFAACSSVADPSRAPEGQATLKVMTLAPYALDGDPGNWDEAKEAHADRLLEVLATRTEGYAMGEELGRLVESPLDLERRDRQLIGGSPIGGDTIPEQSGANRPVPGWSGYRMPVAGLYQTGASTHPGGGITGLSGRSAARVVLEDLGIQGGDALA